MELRNLISFERVAFLKSYSKAAQALYLSQSTVTSHILELEKELATQLFDRSHSPIQITEKGEVFLNYVQQILDLVRHSQSALKNYGKGMSGELNICVSESISTWLLAILNSLKKKHPNIDVKVTTCLSPVTIEKVLNREADFGLTRTCSTFFHHPTLNSTVIHSDEVKLVFSPKHQLAKFDSVILSEIKKFPIVKFGGNTDAWFQVVDVLNKDFSTYHTTIEVSSSQSVKHLLLQEKDMVAFLPNMTVYSELNSGVLISRPIVDIPKLDRYSVLIYHHNDVLTDLGKYFVNTILDEKNSLSKLLPGIA